MSQPTCPAPCNPCIDPADPLSNYSSEAPDNFDPFCRGYSFGKNGKFNPPLQPDNPIANPFFVCFDQSPDCSAPVWPRCMPPGPNGPNSPSDPPSGPDHPLGPQLPTFCNDPQSCTVLCPDLTPATVTIEADRFCWFTKTQANRIAESEACKEAQRRMICVGNLSRIVGCFGQSFTSVLNVTSTQPSVSFGLFDGTLPPGISITKSGPKQLLFIGTPTTTGLFIFSIAVITPATDTMPGDEVIKPFAILIYAVDPSLVDGVAGETYSDQLGLQGPTADVTNLTWQLVSGALPTGLSLATDGTISGTIDGSASGIYIFEVQANITAEYATRIQSTQCRELLSINVISIPTPLAYWKFDEIGGGVSGRADSLNNINLDFFGGGGQTNASMPGKIDNAVLINGVSGRYQRIAPLFDHTWTPSNGFTVCGWFKFVAAAIFVGDSMPYVEIIDGTISIIFKFGMTVAGNPPRFEAFTQVIPNPEEDVDDPQAIVVGDWYFYRIWLDPADNLLRLQINMGAINVAVNPTPMPAGGLHTYLRFSNGTLGESWLCDEVGLWETALSDAAASAIYNSGNGTTYPF